MCCEPVNDVEPVGECKDCGGPIDADGDSTTICAHTPEIDCETCGSAPCDQYC